MSKKELIKWSDQYKQTLGNYVYPTEWVIRTIAGANYPNFVYDKKQYIGKKILDISCGDGRNLQLLLNLGFDVFATETSEETVSLLARRFPDVKFSVGFNHLHSFSDDFFDFALACGSFYYLENDTHIYDNVKELNRILKNNAIFFANMSTKETYVLKDAINLNNGEYRITNDPHNFRNGYCWHIVNSIDELKNAFSPYLNILSCGKLQDDYFGYLISSYISVSQNIK